MISKRKFYELYNRNSPKNKNRCFGPPDARLFLRDLSLPIAYFCAARGISANVVTLIFLFISMVANLLLLIPSIYSLVLVIIFLELAQLLDCTDGQVARYRGTASRSGANLDSLTHALIDGTFIMFFGIRLFLLGGGVFYLIISGTGAFFRAFDYEYDTRRIAITDSEYLKKFYYKFRPTRYLFYIIQTFITEMRFFTLLVLILSLIQPVLPKYKLIETSYILLVFFTFLEIFLYKSFLVVKEAMDVEVKTWKGWS